MSQQINLFNPRFQRQKNYFSTAMLASALGGVLAVVVLTSLVVSQQTAALSAEAAQVKADLTLRETRKTTVVAAFVPRRKSETLQQEVDQAGLQLRNLQQVAGLLEQGKPADTPGYSAYFQALARKRVDGLWLTGVTIHGSGDSIGLQGRALKAGLLPGYLDGLAGEAVLRGKSFGRLEMSEPKPEALVTAQAAQTTAVPTPAPTPRYVEFSLQSAPVEHAAGGRP
jgi:hypothetical protein